MRPKAQRPATTGLIVIDKPAGMSSFAVVADVRRRAAGAKTGHAGTLDPLATGVLVLALGRATKVIDRIVGTSKQYETRIDLGAFTDTDDREGARRPVVVAVPPDEADVRDALLRFRGTFDQRPPAYSAVKVAGRRSYRLARAGDAPELPSRPVTVHALTLDDYAWPHVDLSLHCAKGFYVRSLARALGEALGTGGHCVSIRRTAVGPFTLGHAMKLEDVPEPLGEGDLLPVDAALRMVDEAGSCDATERPGGPGRGVV